MRVDVHTHVVPPLPDFADRYGDPRWPSFVVDDSVGRLTRDGSVVRAVPPTAWDLESRLADMDAAGVDVHVLSPLPPVICDWADPDRGSEWCVRLNEGIAGIVASQPKRFVGLGTVPLQHPDRAVSVLERALHVGLGGVEIGTTAGDRELDHADVRDFFAAAAEMRMTVFVHPLLLGSSPTWTDRIQGQDITFGLGMTTDTAIAAARLVFGGVIEDNPGLRLLLSHGGGTFAWALSRIRRGRELTGAATDHLLRNVHVDSVVYRPANLRYLTDTLGADHVMFGTDYPLPAQDDGGGGVLAELDAPDRALVEADNACGLFGCGHDVQAV